jgi:hypothetical protein
MGGSGSRLTVSYPMRKKGRVQSFFRGYVLKEHYVILDIRYLPWVTRTFFETSIILGTPERRRNARRTKDKPRSYFPNLEHAILIMINCCLDEMDNFTVSPFTDS